MAVCACAEGVSQPTIAGASWTSSSFSRASTMAEGLTDRGIAERLYLSPNTVETHIRHIIDKLGLPATHADNRRVRAVLAYLREA